jgi:outer membrane protein assembly factor BamB
MALVSLLLVAGAVGAFGADWPQWRGPNRDGVWNERGLVEKFAGSVLAPKWRVPVGPGYSGPTVAGGRVYLTDRQTEPKQQERVLCFSEANGKPLWTHAYDAVYGGVGYPDGPRAAVTVHEGRAYALGAVGHLTCLDAAKGTVLWARDLGKEYEIQMPTWGVTAAPLIEGELLILHIGGARNACFVALDKKTGQERWRALPDRPTYVAPVVVTQAGKRVMVCWTAERVVGLDPATGKLHWQYPFPAGQIVIAIATPVVEKDRIFFASFYDGALMLRLLPDRLAVEKVWQRKGANERDTDAIQPIISTPLLIDGYVYGVDSYGELRCLDGSTGTRVWTSYDAVPRARWSTIHFVRNADKVWMFNERGQLLITRLSPKGYEEISRAQLLKPTMGQLRERGGVCWSHPAFANQHVFARNDEELVCASLRAG